MDERKWEERPGGLENTFTKMLHAKKDTQGAEGLHLVDYGYYHSHLTKTEGQAFT